MKLLSLFSGIGAFEKALRNISIEYHLVGFSEIDKYVITAYCAMHGIGENLNLGDIKKIDVNKLPGDIDMITHGSPCQSFSAAGRGKGGDRGSGTRSSLMWHTVDIVGHVRPKYVVWENVKGVLFKKHKHNFDLYLDTLKSYGYNNYYKILNAKDYGIPQNRERVFVISIRKDIDDGSFDFPKPFDSGLRLKHLLDNEVEEKYYINDERANKLLEDLKGRLPNQEISYCLDANYAKGTNVEGFINKKRRQLIQEPIIVASRGRNPDNPSSRESGLPTKQRLEANSQGVCNTLTSVQKDNLLLEPSVLRYERTEYGKQVRKDYENGELDEKIGNMRELRPRRDGISNTLTTVQKDNLVLEPNELQFVGGIGDKDWAGDDKKLSRNYPQGNRVYSPNGIACSQVSNGGGVGGATGLYLESKTSKYRIRKLTPLECWRLMGFDDEDYWIARRALEETYYNGRDRSNTRMYRMAGNSIVVNVLEEIFKNLFKKGD